MFSFSSVSHEAVDSSQFLALLEGNVSEVEYLREYASTASGIATKGNSISVKLSAGKLRRSAVGDNCRCHIQALKERKEEFDRRADEMKVATEWCALRSKDGRVSLMHQFDNTVTLFVRQFLSTLLIEKEAHARMMRREIAIARQTRAVLEKVEEIQSIGLLLGKETSGSVRIRRLNPSSVLFRRCERAYEQSVNRKNVSSGLVCEVFQIENRVGLDEYEAKVQGVEEKESVSKSPSKGRKKSKGGSLVRGLFCDIKSDQLERVIVHGFGEWDERSVFPFWIKRFVKKSHVREKLQDSTPFEIPLVFHQRISCPPTEETKDSKGLFLVVLSRVLVGSRPFTKQSYLDMEEIAREETFKVFGSFFDSKKKTFALNDPVRCFPEFLYLVQNMDVDLQPLVKDEMIRSVASADSSTKIFSIDEAERDLSEVVADCTSHSICARDRFVQRFRKRQAEEGLEIRRVMDAARIEWYSGLKDAMKRCAHKSETKARKDGEHIVGAAASAVAASRRRVRHTEDLLQEEQTASSFLQKLKEGEEVTSLSRE